MKKFSLCLVLSMVFCSSAYASRYSGLTDVFNAASGFKRIDDAGSMHLNHSPPPPPKPITTSFNEAADIWNTMKKEPQTLPPRNEPPKPSF
jgi:hypothetical protein